MSASLVGSEMCIRDSHRTIQHQAPRSPSVSNLASRAPKAKGCAECGLMAVSYTHLTLPTICSV
eukprot:2997607-Alexandrium_andersonii.AAC.1